MQSRDRGHAWVGAVLGALYAIGCVSDRNVTVRDKTGSTNDSGPDDRSASGGGAGRMEVGGSTSGSGGTTPSSGGSPNGAGGVSGSGAGGSGRGGTLSGDGGQPSPGAGGSLVATGGVNAAGGSGGTGASSGTGGKGSGGAVGGGGAANSTCVPGASAGALAPPTDGGQLKTPAFTLQPGQEVFKCAHVEIPIDGEIDAASFESEMVGLHHAFVYRADGDTTALGTVEDAPCTAATTPGANQEWIYAPQAPHDCLDMPPDVTMRLVSRQRVIVDLHGLNTGTNPVQPQLTMNVVLSHAATQPVGALVAFNTGINIPPHSMQTVNGVCNPDVGAKYFLVSTRTWKHATLASVTLSRANGGEQSLTSTTAWTTPVIARWTAPYLTLGAGDTFKYSCSYTNPGDTVITVGATASNELCIAFAYFFPASTTGTCR